MSQNQVRAPSLFRFMLGSHGAEMNLVNHFQLSATHFSLCVANKLIKIVHMSGKITAHQTTQYDPAL